MFVIVSYYWFIIKGKMNLKFNSTYIKYGICLAKWLKNTQPSLR